MLRLLTRCVLSRLRGHGLPKGTHSGQNISNMPSLAIDASVSSKLDIVCRWGSNESVALVGGQEFAE